MSDVAGEDVALFFNQSSATNQTAVNGSTSCEWNDTSANWFFMVVYSLVFLVGLLLNGSIMKFYFCRAQKEASSSIMVYLKNLAAADFMLCLGLPIRIMNYASSSGTIRHVNCYFGASVLHLNMYASIMFMGYIAANRYLKVVHPSGNHILQTVRATHIISTVTWVFLLAVTSSFVILSFQTQEPLTSVPLSCEWLHSDQLTILYQIIHTCSATMFLLVLVSLVFFYYSTSRMLLQVQQRQPEAFSSTKLEKSRRNMLMLVSVFCFCFVPYHLARLPKVFLGMHCSGSRVLFYVMELSIVLSVLNVCLDPIIYFILCKRFRTQLRLGLVCGKS
ncbi:P2Y purinoceptor 14-like [Centropristis striata]|uniref:P2Y purinoceptor 14-like n=1 Tax=Centropristis striata TaxID=184440 RepID=UPI0027DF298D|nr:P2Y purinoceptor 14-like [Centropristis striata]